MLLAYDPSRGSLVPWQGGGGAPPAWLHATAPSEAELGVLERDLGVPRAFLNHSLDIDELARVDRHPSGAAFVVVRVPWLRGGGDDVPYRSTAFGVVALDGRVVTVSPHETELPEALAGVKGAAPERPLRFAVQASLVAAERFLGHLRDIDRRVGLVEDELEASTRNREVLELLKYAKSLVRVSNALASNRIMLESLQRDLPPEDGDVLEDALVEHRQATEMANVARDSLSGTMDAFASIISNNLNAVMKVLTSLTIVLLVPGTVAAFYGMNVPLPGAHHPWAFGLLVAASASLALLVTALFRRRGWL